MENGRNIQLGKNGERFVVSIFERIIGKRRLQKGWYRIKHNSFGKDYNWGTGTDVTIYNEHRQPIIDVEVKNWKHQKKPYSTQTAMEEIPTRFWKSKAHIKLLFITFLSLLTKKARELIQEAGIQIIEISNWIIKATWAETLKDFMYRYYHKLKSYLNLNSYPLYSVHNCSNSVSSSNVSSNNNSKRINSSRKKEHDTNMYDIDIDYILNGIYSYFSGENKGKG